jgi:uncharacterized membrane protein YkvA (DUF1232 family)
LKNDVVALWLAARDRRTPWLAKAVAAAVVAYALSPIDLIPDLIPVVGYLDDLLILPAGIMLAIHLIPDDLMSDLRAKSERLPARPKSYAGAFAVAILWAMAAAILVWLIWPWLSNMGPG